MPITKTRGLGARLRFVSFRGLNSPARDRSCVISQAKLPVGLNASLRAALETGFLLPLAFVVVKLRALDLRQQTDKMSLTTIQTTKQQTRHYLAVAADKMKIATASTMRGENKVRSSQELILTSGDTSHQGRKLRLRIVQLCCCGVTRDLASGVGGAAARERRCHSWPAHLFVCSSLQDR